MGRQAKDDLGQHDTMEQVRKCLSCEKPECNNCGTIDRKGRPGKRIVGVAADGTVVRFDSAADAGRALGIDRSNIYGAIKRRSSTAGYRWSREE